MRGHRTVVARLAATLITAALLATGCGDGAAGDDVAAVASADPADLAFVTGMIPHHQQAVEMSAMAGTRAADPRVKELAGRISAAQGPEIEQMSALLREWGQPVPSAGAGPGGHVHDGMLTADELAALGRTGGRAFDRMFVELMIKHHQGAVAMSTTCGASCTDVMVRQLAAGIARAQTTEIAEMQRLLTSI